MLLKGLHCPIETEQRQRTSNGSAQPATAPGRIPSISGNPARSTPMVRSTQLRSRQRVQTVRGTELFNLKQGE